jgi:hypothetical protein
VLKGDTPQIYLINDISIPTLHQSISGMILTSLIFLMAAEGRWIFLLLT